MALITTAGGRFVSSASWSPRSRNYCRGWPVVFDSSAGAMAVRPLRSRVPRLLRRRRHAQLRPQRRDEAGIDRVPRRRPPRALAGHVHPRQPASSSPRSMRRDPAPRADSAYKRISSPDRVGATAVEAALKVARKATGRERVVSTGAFQGMSLGALAVTGNPGGAAGGGNPLAPPPRFRTMTSPAPRRTSLRLERLMGPRGRGIERPAAVIVETVQGEGGLHVARARVAAGPLGAAAGATRVPLIVDDIQIGCGRTGPVLQLRGGRDRPGHRRCSRSRSAATACRWPLTLAARTSTCGRPGEHSGTFRGLTPAMVTAVAALRRFWADDILERTQARAQPRCARSCAPTPTGALLASAPPAAVGWPRGWCAPRAGPRAIRIVRAAFERGLLVELAGPQDEVVKLVAPLTITDTDLAAGLEILTRRRCRRYR